MSRRFGYARKSISEGDLAAGNLVRLFDIAVVADESYYLVWRKDRTDAKVFAFRDWMIGEKKRKN
jgi:DNA-binding transcriptional LysR family regulator